MFKPLLKTLPSLSGNMKLVCRLSNYSNKENYNVFVGNVNEAYLTTLSHNIYDKNININLKNNNFEYDVKKFFSYYTDIFYKTNFTFSKINIPNLDVSSDIHHSNTDFQYGCKRVSYKKSGSICSFFAPIYVESKEDIQDKYFIIRVEFKKVFSLIKYIKIPISNIGEENYLADYLTRYVEKIDDKVIYCSNTYKNIYYGISLLWGGFVRIEDNISANLYRQYYTINDFDSIINQGFKRNSIMMKQILPLAFYFDPNDLLTDTEKQLYKNCEIKISGKWYNGKDTVPFYDFSDNYKFYTENIYTLGYNKKFNYSATNNNIMDFKYPSLNESSSENYKYINSISKNYNRWKLKYSSDLNPYIINLHHSFSANQNSLYMYKEFPIMYNSINSICTNVTKTIYNMNYDFSLIYHSLNHQTVNSPTKYLNLYNHNYITNFFNILYKKNYRDDHEQKYYNIFDKKLDYIWGNVNSDGKLYYNGILYDFNKIYNENPDMDIKIDKFCIFVNPIFNYITTQEYIDNYKEAKFLFSYLGINNELNFDLSYIMSYTDNIQNNITVKKDPNGNYVKYKDCQYTIDENNEDIDNSNIYYSVNDLYILNQKAGYRLIQGKEVFDSDYDNIYNKINNNFTLYEGFKIIEAFNNLNICSDMFKTIINAWNDKIDYYNDCGMIYREKRILSMENIYSLKDKLYFSIYPNKTKYKLIKDYELIKKSNQQRIVLYIKDKFIKVNEFNANSSILNINQSYFDKLDKYYFINGLYDKDSKILYTYPSYLRLSKIENNYGEITLDNDENFIYVDPYNINRMYGVEYGNGNIGYQQQPLNSSSLTEPMYCKFLNPNHIDLYVNRTYKSSLQLGKYIEYNNGTLEVYNSNNPKHNGRTPGNLDVTNSKDAFKNIRFKIRTFKHINFKLDPEENTEERIDGMIYKNENFDTIVIQDIYKKPSDYGIENIEQLLVYITYNESTKLFNFKPQYYKDIQPTFDKDGNAKWGKLKVKRKDNKPDEEIIVPKIYYFEICFIKRFLKLDEMLYHLILNRDNDNIFKDLYLYHLYDPKDYIGEMYYSSYKLSETESSSRITNLDNTLDNIKNNNELCLVPYFNSIWEEHSKNTKIYSDYFLNNIIEVKNLDLKRYRFNTSHIDLLVNINYVENSYNYLINERYSLLKDISDTCDNSYEFSLKYKNMCDNSYETSYTYFKDYSGMITYTYNDINYGFYIINSEFDNTKHTINLVNENIDPINCVEYINNIPVEYFNINSYSYLDMNYKYMIPYIKSSNIVNTLLNNVSPMIKPTNYKLKSQLIQNPNTDLYGTYSYSIYVTKKTQYIELNRYFDHIVPYIPETNIISSYYLYYKNTDKFIENDLYIKKISYIMHYESKTIDNYVPISYFNNNNYLTTTYQYTPYEYKHYNNNKIINLEKVIKINVSNPAGENNLDNYFTEEQYIELENNKDKIIDIFIKYMKENSDIDNLITDSNILFLYKKYDIKFSHIFKKFYHNIKQYKLTITFTLL